MSVLDYRTELDGSLTGLGLSDLDSFFESFGNWIQNRTADIDFDLALAELKKQAKAAGVPESKLDQLIEDVGKVAVSHQATIANLGTIVDNSPFKKVDAAFAAILTIGVICLIAYAVLA